MAKTKDEKKRSIKKKLHKIHSQTVKKKPLSMKTLIKYKKFLDDLASPSLSDDAKRILKERMHDDEFDVVCRCIGELVSDKGTLPKQLSNEQFAELGKQIEPNKTGLQYFLDEKKRKKINKHKIFNQKGGQLGEIIGPIIAGLLPVATAAINKWLSGKKH